MVISKESIKYSLKNLQHRKARSFLTILSIFIGIATIFIFISFGWGLYDYMQELSSSSTADKLIIQSKGAGLPGLDTTFKLTDDDLEVIAGVAGIYEASGAYFKVVEVKQKDSKKYTFMISYDAANPLILDMFNVDSAEGRGLNPKEKGKVVLGYNYQEDEVIFPNGYRVNDNIEVNDEKIKIIGFLESIGNPQDDSQLYITNEYMEDLYPGEVLSYGMIIARVDIGNIDLIIERVEKALRKERDLEKGNEDFSVQSYQDMIEAYSGALNIVIGFVILIALISVVVSAVNTANTMITSVLERIKEIGVIKSIGARNSEIFKIFLFESGFLGFVAGVIGVGLGWLISYAGGALLASLGWGFLSPHFSIELFVGLVLFATITGAVSGVIPAMKASKINPVDALRYE
jgi:putative ABC transport system permease protein